MRPVFMSSSQKDYESIQILQTRKNSTFGKNFTLGKNGMETMGSLTMGKNANFLKEDSV
jgi:hypothetical protein